jgi:hypothetical protein
LAAAAKALAAMSLARRSFSEGGETKMQSPDAKMRRGNEEVWLFELVNR